MEVCVTMNCNGEQMIDFKQDVCASLGKKSVNRRHFFLKRAKNQWGRHFLLCCNTRVNMRILPKWDIKLDGLIVRIPKCKISSRWTNVFHQEIHRINNQEINRKQKIDCRPLFYNLLSNKAWINSLTIESTYGNGEVRGKSNTCLWL